MATTPEPQDVDVETISFIQDIIERDSNETIDEKAIAIARHFASRKKPKTFVLLAQVK